MNFNHSGGNKKIITKTSKNSLSTLESEDSEFNQSSSAASTLSSTGNSSSTSGIANSITYFPSLDEEESILVETSTPVANKQPLHSLRFFVDPKKSNCKKSYDTRSLDRRRLLKENLLTIKEDQTKAYCTLRRRSDEKLVHSSESSRSLRIVAETSNNISNVSLEFPRDENRVCRVVKSSKEQVEDESSKELVNKNDTFDTSDDDDLSHAEELSYSSQVTSSEVESLTGSNSNLNSNIVLPTGWHRHPGHHHHHHHPIQNSANLGPLDEIVQADSDSEDPEDNAGDHIYSTVVKKEENGDPPKRPRFTSVLRSSRILRRHTTYYHAKQFDSLPPQASSSSMSMVSTKPHVHSWHRHKQSRLQYQVSKVFKLLFQYLTHNM